MADSSNSNPGHLDDGNEEATVHHVGEAYSKKNPVPTVPRFLQHQRERAEESKKQEKDLADRRKAQEAEAANQNQTQPDQNTKADTKSAISKPPKDARTSDVPIGDDKTNVLFHPPPEIELGDVFTSIKEHTRQASYVSAAAIILLDFLFIGGGFVGFLRSLVPAAGVGFAIFYILTEVASSAHGAEIHKAEPEVEKIRYVPESVEWMNNLLDTVWQVVSQDVFKQVAQQVEDQVKAVIPVGFVKLKVLDLGIGSRPVRVLSMRSLPDSEFGEMVAAHGDTKGMTEEEVAKVEEKAKNELGGVFYNLEVALAYHGEPLVGHKKRIHFDVVVLVGGVPLPIFVETREFVMSIRIRLQMHPDLPFLKQVTFALNEPPKVLASVVLGFPGSFNLLSLPLLDNLITSQIAANTKELCRPKSMSIDMVPILGGNDAVTETNSVGLLYIKIGRAENLRRQDRRGPGADPYITVSFSKYEKPMYATKMIIGDLNPVWEEMTCILINADHVKRQESLLVKLWDSDRSGKDDVTGQVEIPLVDLIKEAGKTFKREDLLQHEVAGAAAQGKLFWEVGFFPEAEFNRKLLNMDEAKKDQKVTDKTKPEEVELSALNCRPDPEYPTGVLSVTIYQCINIEVPNPKGDKKDPQPGDEEGEDVDSEEEESEEGKMEGYLPSVYCTADINDQFSCRTRTKAITKSPIFNSTVESYITDWRNVLVSIAARDSRRKGKDFLIGAVVLKAADIFKNCAAVSDWYDFVGGGGSGRVRVSILFRSSTIKLERHNLGWNVGRFEFSSDTITVDKIKVGKLKLKTCGGVKTLNPTGADSGRFNVENSLLRVPVFNRYLAPLIFQFYAKSGDRKAAYYSIIWLHNLIDNETRDFSLTVYKTDKPKRFTQNCIEGIPDMHCKVEAVGSVHFKGRFRSGMCPEFKENLDDHDEEDTFEVWEALDKLDLRDVHEADAGASHPGVITGTDKVRDPDTTQAEHIVNGGTGRYSDKEARNVDSTKTGTMSSPALSNEEVQNSVGQRVDLIGPNEWEKQHGKGATPAPFSNPDDATGNHHPAEAIAALANETAPPQLASPQDIDVVSQKEYDNRAKSQTSLPSALSPNTSKTPTTATSATSGELSPTRSSYVVKSMLDVPDATDGSDSTSNPADAVPKNADYNIDRSDTVNVSETASENQSGDISSAHGNSNPNYFITSAGKEDGSDERHNETTSPTLGDMQKAAMPRANGRSSEEGGEQGGRRVSSNDGSSLAQQIRNALPANSK